MIVFLAYPAGVGLADPGYLEDLAAPSLIVEPAAEPGLILFLQQLLNQLELLAQQMPDVWVPFARLLEETYGTGT